MDQLKEWQNHMMALDNLTIEAEDAFKIIDKQSTCQSTNDMYCKLIPGLKMKYHELMLFKANILDFEGLTITEACFMAIVHRNFIEQASQKLKHIQKLLSI